MNIITRVFTIIVLSVCVSAPVWALSGLKLLTVEAGARPAGMGGAFTAVAEDPYSAAYNPAAGYKIGPLAASVGYNSYWQNISIQTGYLAFEKKEITYMTGIQFAAVSNLQGRTEPTSDYYPFDAHDVAIKAGAAFRVDKDVVFGFMVGWLFEKIEQYRGSTFSADLGLMTTPLDKLDVGFAVLNLGSKMMIREEKYKLPTTFRAGASYQFKNFLPAADIVVQDDKLHTHLGGEYNISDNFFLRAGYRIGYDLSSFSAGAGFSKRNLRIDYAFVPYKNEFNDSHLINLTFQL